MSAEPLPTGRNGRDTSGRFVAGNTFARGNPMQSQVQKLRAVLFEVVTPERFRNAIESVLVQAEAGDRRCLEELADRLLGKAAPTDLQERVDALETAIRAQGKTL